eukprot:5615435-Pyramimonas_sp.AAC.1
MSETVLAGFETLGVSSRFDGSFGGPAAASGGAEVDAWAHALPPDFKRTGVEIYRNIRAAGSTSTRCTALVAAAVPGISKRRSTAGALVSGVDVRFRARPGLERPG